MRAFLKLTCYPHEICRNWTEQCCEHPNQKYSGCLPPYGRSQPMKRIQLSPSQEINKWRLTTDSERQYSPNNPVKNRTSLFLWYKAYVLKTNVTKRTFSVLAADEECGKINTHRRYKIGSRVRGTQRKQRNGSRMWKKNQGCFEGRI